jgi:hypothetical protein
VGSTNSVEKRGQREVSLKLQMSETRILIKFLWFILQETANLDQVCQNFGISEGVEPSNPAHSPQLGTPLPQML